MEKVVVERSIWIAAPRERVWAALTSAERLMQWWGDYWEIPTLEAGATLRFGAYGARDDLMQATIDVLDPPSEFTLR